MPYYVIQEQPTVGEQIVGGLIVGAVVGIASWFGRKAAREDHKKQVAVQTAAQERLMEVAHQQRLQEITYIQQIETQKQLLAQREKPVYTDPFFILSMLLILGIGVFALTKRTKKF